SALQDNNNYFTAAQLVELLNQIPLESGRLTLAKLGYAKLTDPANFTLVYQLLNDPAAKTELTAFIRSQGADVSASFSESFRTPLNEASFKTLLDRSRRNMDPSTRVNEIAAIITNQTQYFTVDQVRRLLELVDFETGRLQLLKAVYSQVTDPWNFPRLYSMLSTDAAKLELVNRVISTAENSGLVNYNLGKPATGAEEFTKLINTAREKAAPVVYLTGIFNENRYYFSAAQAVQMISLAEAEATRLALAKAAYRSIVDPENFISLSFPLLHLPASRNELLIYAYSFRMP
ncbi:MAG TPA: DUF4476 domain-containing protein, partial [Chitinophagaceae bacterium]